MIEPRTLKGFRDYLPEVMMPREAIMETARRVYRRYGFSPIDTPVLEYLEFSRAKAAKRLTDNSTVSKITLCRQVGMRFDLTVPLVSLCGSAYQTSSARPSNVITSRLCGAGRVLRRVVIVSSSNAIFDTIGTESVVADIETGLVIHELLLEIGISNFCIRINNRQVLSGVLAKLG